MFIGGGCGSRGVLVTEEHVVSANVERAPGAAGICRAGLGSGCTLPGGRGSCRLRLPSAG